MNRRRTVACYCATFLKPEMQHIYRQITAVNRFKVAVFTGKRENEDQFPIADITVVRHDAWRWLRRIIGRQLLDRPLFLIHTMYLCCTSSSATLPYSYCLY